MSDIIRLVDELAGPTYRLRMASAIGRGSSPGLLKSAKTRQTRAEADIERIIRSWVSSHPEEVISDSSTEG